MIVFLTGIWFCDYYLSPRYFKDVKPRWGTVWSTLRTNKQTNKPNYVNQTGTIKHLFAFDQPRTNIWVRINISYFLIE